LDVVVTRKEDVSIVEVMDIGISDHRLLTWSFKVAEVKAPVYKTQSRRTWKTFDADAFRIDLAASSLCSPSFVTDDPSMMASRFEEVIIALLGVHVPRVDVTCRVTPTN
jgi:hypothetical protein